MSNLDGKWATTTNTPMGQQKGVLTLQTDGKSLSGNISSAQGSVDIRDGSVDGDSAKWKCDIQQPVSMTLEFGATVSEDGISGTVKLGMFGNAQFSGARLTD